MSRNQRLLLGEILGGLIAAADHGQESTGNGPPADVAGEAGAAAVAPAKARPKNKAKPSRKRPTKQLPPWNVVLLDDDEHTYDYVIEMLCGVFGHPVEKAFHMACEVDASGRVIVCTTHRELAELKREQVIAWGADPRISACRGGMSAVIEPAK